MDGMAIVDGESLFKPLLFFPTPPLISFAHQNQQKERNTEKRLCHNCNCGTPFCLTDCCCCCCSSGRTRGRLFLSFSLVCSVTRGSLKIHSFLFSFLPFPIPSNSLALWRIEEGGGTSSPIGLSPAPSSLPLLWGLKRIKKTNLKNKKRGALEFLGALDAIRNCTRESEFW